MLPKVTFFREMIDLVNPRFKGKKKKTRVLYVKKRKLGKRGKLV